VTKSMWRRRMWRLALLVLLVLLVMVAGCGRATAMNSTVLPTFEPGSPGDEAPVLPAYALQVGLSAGPAPPPFAPGESVPVCPAVGSCVSAAYVAYNPNTPLVACTALYVLRVRMPMC
jgi:hypothetical protein